MDTSSHNLAGLFKQLGLPDDEDERRAFLQSHGPLPANMPLSEAPFWSSSQAAFLREALQNDADWAPIVDQLNAMLRD